MGYTHYWRKKQHLDPTDFKTFSDSVNKILVGSSLALDYNEPNRPPETSDILVCFNGKEDLGHETFYFERDREDNNSASVDNDWYFDFCKTARKPYDKYVVATLILAKRIFGSAIKVSSDGDIAGEEWDEGKKLLEEKLNVKIGKLSENADNELKSVSWHKLPEKEIILNVVKRRIDPALDKPFNHEYPAEVLEGLRASLDLILPQKNV